MTVPLLVLCALILFPVAWKPWVSPRYAAQYLVVDDGKGLVFWMPAAAKIWGSRILEPLADETQNFDLLVKEVEARTVFEIITEDGLAVSPDMITKLLVSKSVPARLLGMYALSVRGQSVEIKGAGLVSPVF